MNSKVLKLLNEAIFQVGQGNHEEAISILKSLLEYEIDKSIQDIIFEQIAVCYIQLGMLQEAKYYLEQFIFSNLNVGVTDTHYMLLNVYEDLGEFKNAVSLYKQFSGFSENMPFDYYCYKLWLLQNEPNGEALELQRKHIFKVNPKISIVVPVYNTPDRFLKDMIDSVLKQTYSNWELCLADGNSSNESVREIIREYATKYENIKYIFLNENKGISENTNNAIYLATGEYIAFLDHDDTITEDALYEIVKEINNTKEGMDCIYSDFDYLSEGGAMRAAPNFSPDFSPVTLIFSNYIIHFVIIKKELLDEIGLLNSEFDGAQDYDILLRVAEATEKITHIRKILYNWRTHSESMSTNIKSKPFALRNAYKLLNEIYKKYNLGVYFPDGEEEYCLCFKVQPLPKTTIVIINQDGFESIRRTINSILQNTIYENYEILLIDHNSTNQETLDFYDSLKSNHKIKCINYEEDSTNMSAIYNFAATVCNSEFLVFLSRTTEILNESWLNYFVIFAQQEDIGICGGSVNYIKKEVIMTSGIEVVGCNFDLKQFYDCNRFIPNIKTISNYSGLSNVCLCIKKDIFIKAGGFDTMLPNSLNSIDLCIKLSKLGYHIVFNPFVVVSYWEDQSLYYNEATRNLDNEVQIIKGKWVDIFSKLDPYVSPYWNFDKGDCMYKIF